MESRETTETGNVALLTSAQAKARLAELERAKQARRKALNRVGFQSAAAAMLVLTADDLLRAVSQELTLRATHNSIAQQIRAGFHHIGEASAATVVDASSCEEAGGTMVYVPVEENENPLVIGSN